MHVGIMRRDKGTSMHGVCVWRAPLTAPRAGAAVAGLVLGLASLLSVAAFPGMFSPGTGILEAGLSPPASVGRDIFGTFDSVGASSLSGIVVAVGGELDAAASVGLAPPDSRASSRSRSSCTWV